MVPTQRGIRRLIWKAFFVKSSQKKPPANTKISLEAAEGFFDWLSGDYFFPRKRETPIVFSSLLCPAWWPLKPPPCG